MCRLNRVGTSLLRVFVFLMSFSAMNVVNGQTVWDITANAGYNNDIAGIGRDDCGGQNQKQSKSVNSDAVVTIGRGSIAATNAANANTFANDLSFFIWGNNDASAQSNWNLEDVSISGDECEYLILNRVWKGVETNSIASLVFRVDVDNANYDIPALPSGNDGSYYLYVDDDGDFTNGGTNAYQMSNSSGSLWDYTFTAAENMFFTFGAKLNTAFGITIEDGSGNLSVSDTETNLTGALDLYAVIPFALDHAVSANYASADGTATVADSDYSSAGSGTATISAGSTSALINDVVTIISNTVSEPDESLTISLSSPSGSCLGSDDTYTVTIQNDDTPSLSINDVSIGEAAGTATLTITASNTSVSNITVVYNANDNTAIDSQDYSDVTGTATITAGSTTTTVNVPITNDLLDENSENFTLDLSSPSGATISDGARSYYD